MHGKYEKGKDTRNKILNMAKQLFKQKGFSKMRISELCDILNIKLGTFTYYYKTKTDLVSDVCAEHLLKAYRRSSPLLPKNSTTFQLNLTADYFYYFSIFTDPDSSKFYFEVLSSMSVFDYIGKHVKKLYASYNYQFKLGLSDEDLRDVLLVDSALRREFFTDMFTKYGYDIPHDAVYKYLRKLHIYLGKSMGIDNNIIMDYIKTAEELTEKYLPSDLYIFEPNMII